MGYLTSGNEIVDAMGSINISGNIIPAVWYRTITKENGKPYLLAIVILADIVYWYRPSEVRDQGTGHILGWKKKFSDDLLRQSYQYYADLFGESKKTIKTANFILISCGARLAPFDIKELRDLTSYDELELDTLGEKKTALFVIISDTDATFNFIVSIMYSQLFNLLCDKADDVYNGRLPIHVRCLLDEFANIGQIPQFEKLIATIRSREISASIILQSKSQLKALYKDNASTIEGNCDTTLFLGGKEKDTLKDLAEILGKETIDLYNTSDTRGTSQSYGLNYQKTGKELMSQDEIAVMDGSKCIMQLRGVRPFFSDKFDITKHKQYPLLSDYDKKNEFDIEKYVKNRNRLRFKRNDVVNEVCDVGEITA